MKKTALKTVTKKNRRNARESAIESLESRIAPAAVSGVVFGAKYTKVSFHDTYGDLVVVNLINETGATVAQSKGYSFEVTLAGGAIDNADIQEIDVQGPENAPTTGPKAVLLKVNVIPQAVGGGHFTPGFTQIGLITDNGYVPANAASPAPGTNVPTALAGIKVRGAVVNDFEFDGDLLGSISEDISHSSLKSLVAQGDIIPGSIGFGSITANDVGTITFLGQQDLSNPLVGDIDVNSLHMINAPYSDLLGSVNVASPTTLTGKAIATTAQFHDIAGQLNLQTVSSITAHDISGDITLTGTGTMSVKINASGVISGNIVAQAPTEVPMGLVPNALPSTDPTLVLSLANSQPFSGSITAGAVEGSGKNGLLTFSGDFTGSITSTVGDVSSISVTGSKALFEGTVTSADQVGNISAAGFSGANISGSQIGAISATSVAGITGSSFQATNGELTGNGNITSIISIGSIAGNSVIATGAVGAITSSAGSIGGSTVGTSATIQEFLEDPLDFTGPAGNTIQAASVGNITALKDIGGNQIEVAGSVGNITATAGRIAFNEVTATEGSIGNITAHSNAVSFIFDGNGNVIVGSVDAIGNTDNDEISGSAIEGDTFTAGNSIGNITATASAFGVNGSEITVYGNAILHSNFTAGAIGTVTASAASTARNDSGDAIAFSTFVGTGTDGTAIGNVTATASGGDAIADTTFHAAGGEIGSITGTSVNGEGITFSQISADNGDVGDVTGIVTGFSHGAGLDHVSITAGSGPGNPFGIGDVTGVSLDGNGIVNVNAVSGLGGIGQIFGSNNGNVLIGTGSGILNSTFSTTGGILGVSGFSTTSTGIDSSTFNAAGDGIAFIQAEGNSTANGAANGITASTFVTAGDIGDISVGEAIAGFTSAGAGAIAIFDSTFTAGGSIGDITAHTSGLGPVQMGDADGNDGIDQSTFTAGAYQALSGIIASDDESGAGEGGIGTIVAITDHGNHASTTDDAIDNSSFYAGTGGIGVFNPDLQLGKLGKNFTGPNEGVNAFATSLGEDGIHGSTFLTTGDIGDISVDVLGKGSDAGAGDVAILRSTFTAGGSIGDIDAYTSGLATVENSGTGYDAINRSTFTAGAYFTSAGGISVVHAGEIAAGSDGGIGGIFALTDHGTTGSRVDDGISSSTFLAGTGGIAFESSINADSTDTGRYGIVNSTFTTTGSIGDINVGVDIGVGDVGILNSTFTAAGSIGNISAFTSGLATSEQSGSGYDAIHGATFTAGALVTTPVDDSIATVHSGEVALNASGGIGSITATTLHGHASSTIDDGIASGQFYAGSGGIAADGSITASASSTGQYGIQNSTFETTGSIGNITAGAGDVGIYNSTFAAGGSIGNITAITSGQASVEHSGDGFNGIDASHFTAAVAASTNADGSVEFFSGLTFGGTGGIGQVTGQGTTDGIANSTFVSGSGGITGIEGDGGSIGIYKVIAQTVGSIGNISASSGTGNDIDLSGFNAQQNIGDGTFTDSAISVNGSISNSVFIAGIYLGSAFEEGIPGNGAGASPIATDMGGANLFGFNNIANGGTGTGIIGGISVGGGISNSTIDGGLYALDEDAPTSLDLAGYITGSGVGPISAPAGISGTYVVGGSIENTSITGGSLSNTTYVAGDSGGAGIGEITVSLGLAPGSAARAISDVFLDSHAGVGAITGSVSGFRGYVGTYVAAIANLDVEANGTVGAITGTNTASGDNGFKTSGIYELALSTSGTVGAINGTVNDTGFDGSVSDNTEIIGYGIRDSSIAAGGTVGAITGATSATTGSSYGIQDFGVETEGSIGNIISTGNLDSSSFLAGEEATINMSLTFVGYTAINGQSVGTVSVTGSLTNSDIVASVTTESVTHFGNLSDDTAHGGSIGAITISAAESYSTTPANEPFGIEAATIASLTINAVGKTLPGVLGGNILVSEGGGGG